MTIAPFMNDREENIELRKINLGLRQEKEEIYAELRSLRQEKETVIKMTKIEELTFFTVFISLAIIVIAAISYSLYSLIPLGFIFLSLILCFKFPGKPKKTKLEKQYDSLYEILRVTNEELGTVEEGLKYGLYTRADLERLQLQKKQSLQKIEDFKIWKNYFTKDYPDFEDCRLKMEFARQKEEEKNER